jgi:hypothetical protein
MISSNDDSSLIAGNRGWAADGALLAAVVIAGSVSRHAVYTGYGVTILVGCVVVLATAVGRGVGAAGPSRAGVLVALAGSVFAQVIKPPYMNVEGGTWLLRAGVWVCLITTVLAAALLLAAVGGVPRRRASVAVLGLAGVLAAYLLVTRGSTRPLIDVWAILQGASLGVLHGQNPYDMIFPNVPRGQVNDAFNYLPATFLVPVPSRLLLGDARYAEAAVLAGGVGVLLGWALRSARPARPARSTQSTQSTQSAHSAHSAQSTQSTQSTQSAHSAQSAQSARPAQSGRSVRRASTAPALALLVGVLPGALYDVQQAWNETILAGALIAAAVLLAAGRAGWAAVFLAVALATKQHVVLLLPLWACWPVFGWRRAAAAGAGAAAITLPWALADFDRFRYCVFDFFVQLPTRHDSLSVWQLLPGPLRTVTLLVLTAGAYALVLRRTPRTPAGLLLGSGLVLAAFDLANKQSFLNQWLLAAQLVVAGLALAAAGHPRHPVVHSRRRHPQIRARLWQGTGTAPTMRP